MIGMQFCPYCHKIKPELSDFCTCDQNLACVHNRTIRVVYTPSEDLVICLDCNHAIGRVVHGMDFTIHGNHVISVLKD